MTKSKVELKIVKSSTGTGVTKPIIRMNEPMDAAKILSCLFRSYAGLVDIGGDMVNRTEGIRESTSKEGHWHFIPMRGGVDLIQIVYQIGIHESKMWMMDMDDMKHNRHHRTMRFLDVGCGIGNICGLVNGMSIENIKIDAFGIEYQEAYVNIARRFATQVKKVDALKYDKYDQFDILYFYCPMVDTKKQLRLERNIKADMKIGAYLITCSAAENPYDDSRFQRIHLENRMMTLQVFRKVSE